jgi:two-component sensor histidine kinase
MNWYRDVLLKRYAGVDSERYFQASVLAIVHLSIAFLFALVLSFAFTNPMMNLLLTLVSVLSGLSLIGLYLGYLRIVTIVSVSGMGLLGSLTAFATPDFHPYEAYMLAASHMLIILFSSLLTHQKRYTFFTGLLGVVYLVIHIFIRVIPSSGDNLALSLDDSLIGIFMVIVTSFVVIRSLQRRQRLLFIAEEQSRLKDIRSVELEKSLKEKEILLNEVHHRVKNNLNVAISLIRMQMDQTTLPPESMGVLQDSIGRLHSMALVHERLYAGGNFSAIEFKPYIDSVFQSVFWSFDRNNLNFEVEVDPDLQIGVDRAIPCGLILNELITNVYKHAYPQHGAGEARISFRRENGNYCLSVEDKGIGILQTDWSNTNTLGLKVVYLLVEQLQATLEVDNKDGTQVRISFPVDPT